MSEQPTPPFRVLGIKLKTLRQKLHESVAEVSSAIEIDEVDLTRIEQGHERPSEDILLLLINHFGIQDDDAANLWFLAGYEQPLEEDLADDGGMARPTIMLMGIDPRVIYSDGVHVAINPGGLVMHFSQTGPSNQNLAIARVGMSHDQARTVVKVLVQALNRFDNPPKPQALPQKLDK